MDLGLTASTLKQARARMAARFFPNDALDPAFTIWINEVVEQLHALDRWIGSHATFSVDVTTEKSFYLPYYLETVLNARLGRQPARVQATRYEFIHDGLGEITSEDSVAGSLIDLGVSGISVPFPEEASTLGFAASSATDYGKIVRVLGYNADGVKVIDSNGVPGEAVILASGVVATTNTFSAVQGVQKDVTAGRVTVTHVEDELTLLTLEPWMENPMFRGYRVLDQTAERAVVYCKRRPVPVRYEEDYIFPGNLRALTLGCYALQAEANGERDKVITFFNDAAVVLNEEAVRYNGGNEEHPPYAPWGVGIAPVYNPI